MEIFPLSQLPPRGAGPIPIPFSLVIFFCPTQLCGDFLAPLEVCSLLPAFSRCPVRIIPHVDVFVGEGELHVLLLHHLDLIPSFIISLELGSSSPLNFALFL